MFILGGEAMKYRKKPVVVEAVRWDGSYKSTKEVLEFMGQTVGNDSITRLKFEDYCEIVNREGMQISTLEGGHIASVGDHIIKGVKGEFYPCKPDIFEMTYELVE